MKNNDLEPSYQDIVDELVATISNCIFENTLLKSRLKKLEEFIKQSSKLSTRDDKDDQSN